MAALNSFACDYFVRQKTTQPSLPMGVVLEAPVPPPAAFMVRPGWLDSGILHEWLRPRIIELSYTAWNLHGFASDLGYRGPPFRWDEGRRATLAAELDAAFFHLYGLNRDDTDYILDTFPIVRKHDEKAQREYRTKRVILEIYDAMAEAARTGVPYVTRLDPPPADPRVAHPPREAT